MKLEKTVEDISSVGIFRNMFWETDRRHITDKSKWTKWKSYNIILVVHQ